MPTSGKRKALANQREVAIYQRQVVVKERLCGSGHIRKLDTADRTTDT
jgi:hypothetical protein